MREKSKNFGKQILLNSTSMRMVMLSKYQSTSAKIIKNSFRPSYFCHHLLLKLGHLKF